LEPNGLLQYLQDTAVGPIVNQTNLVHPNLPLMHLDGLFPRYPPFYTFIFQAVSLIHGAKKIIILVQLFLINVAYSDFQILIPIPHMRRK